MGWAGLGGLGGRTGSRLGGVGSGRGGAGAGVKLGTGTRGGDRRRTLAAGRSRGRVWGGVRCEGSREVHAPLLLPPQACLVKRSRSPNPKGASPSVWGTVLKKRLVKLVVNFLFYFRTDEAEPIGALLLEHCRITKEEENVFSISFIEEPERKYCFECDSEEQCQEWIEALKRASYEFMRRSLIFYRNEIQKMTGKDPLEQYGISEEARFQLATRKQ
uniref:Sesquipedalian n=1 Tax=Anser cygnoides TaxID=8845 RepID=A0A8B9IJX7_ANSCY